MVARKAFTCFVHGLLCAKTGVRSIPPRFWSNRTLAAGYHSNKTLVAGYHGNKTLTAGYHGNRTLAAGCHGNRTLASGYHGNRTLAAGYHGNRSLAAGYYGNSTLAAGCHGRWTLTRSYCSTPHVSKLTNSPDGEARGGGKRPPRNGWRLAFWSLSVTSVGVGCYMYYLNWKVRSQVRQLTEENTQLQVEERERDGREWSELGGEAEEATRGESNPEKARQLESRVDEEAERVQLAEEAEKARVREEAAKARVEQELENIRRAREAERARHAEEARQNRFTAARQSSSSKPYRTIAGRKRGADVYPVDELIVLGGLLTCIVMKTLGV